MSGLLTLLRRGRTLLWTAVSILIVLAAVVVGVGKLLMPYSARYQPQLEAWLSEEFGRPVVLESFSGEWNAFGPRLRLSGMRLRSPAAGGSDIAIDEAALDLKPLNALIPGKAWYNFLVIGADFTVVEDGRGGLELSGFGTRAQAGREGSGGLRSLVGIGELILEDSSLEYVHPPSGVRLRLSGVDARLQLGEKSGALTLDAELADADTGRVFGEVEATVLAEFTAAGGFAGTRWHLALKDVMLDPLQRWLPENRFVPQQGLVNGEFWGDWADGRPLVVRGVADLRNGLLDHGEDVISVEHANARLAWTYGSRGDWRVDLNELKIDDGLAPWRAPNIALARDLERDVGFWLSADALPLGVSLQLARDILAVYGEPWPADLPDTASGDVSGLDLVLGSDWRLRLARGEARGAGVGAWGRWPALSGIDADIDLDEGAGMVALHARSLAVDWPGMFAETLRFSMPSCHVGLDLRTGWQADFGDCSLINADLALNGDLLLAGNTGRPAIDANFVVTRGDIARVSPYWPERILKPGILSWLRSALVGGEIEEGRFQIRGDMDDWPFRNQRGRFEATARVTGGELVYRPDWPRVERLAADLHFLGASMQIDARDGVIGGVDVDQASARIDDFKRAVLEVRYQADSTLPALMGFLRASPILATSGYPVERFVFGGPAATQGEIRMPLGRTPGQLTVDGSVRLGGATFSDPGSGVSLTAIDGQVRYDRHGMKGTDLEVRYRDRSAVLDVMASTAAGERFRATLTGRLAVADLLPDFLQGAEPLARIGGESEWRVAVVVPGRTGANTDVDLDTDTGLDTGLDTDVATGGTADAEGPWLVLESELEGVDLDLPAPLRKAAGDRLPFRLRWPLTGLTRTLDVQLAGRASAAIEFGTPEPGLGTDISVRRAAVTLGEGEIELPPPGQFRIEGSADTFDLDGWTDIFVGHARDIVGPDGLQLDRFDVRAGELRFLDRRFSDVGLGLQRVEDGLRADFAGEAIDGHVLFMPGARGGSLTAEFERLALDPPVSDGISMRSNPSELPELHLYARSFRYAGIEMGETRIEAYPTPGGFHFEKVEAASESLTLRASGDWLMLEDGPRSDFRILVTTESLGEFLESVDISSSLEGGQTMLRFNAWWPGPPAAFALARLNGEVEFSVTRGQITNASAGSGRLLGLLSVQALPRRLSLDFRDVFDAGFDFEEAHGTFRMENGTASTDDVELSSSAAKISLSGRTDLVEQSYDQVMTVQPGVGNTLPVIGAIAGGPGGAAAGLALQGLLHDELGEATQVKYTITGSWEEPRIEPVLQGDAATKPAADGR